MNPIVIDTFQLNLAIELGAQAAAREEIKRQVQPQMPDFNIEVSGAAIDIEIRTWPTLDIGGREVVFR